MFFDHPFNVFAITLFTPLLLTAIVSLCKSRFIAYAAIATAGLKLILAIINSYWVQFYTYDADFNVLDQMAQQWAALPLFDFLQEIGQATGRYFFAYVLSIIYRIFGEALFVIFIINIYLTSVVAIATYDCSLALFGNKKLAQGIFIFVLLFPMYFVYSIDPSREPLVQASLALAIKQFCFWHRDFKPGRIPGLIFFGGIAAAIHTALVIPLLILITNILYKSAQGSWRVISARRQVSFLTTIVFASIALSVLVFSGWALKKVGGNIAGLGDVEVLDRYSTRRDADSRTGYLSSAEGFESLGSAVAALPVRFFLFITKPWPTDIGIPLDLLSVYANLFLCASLYALFFRRSLLKRYQATYLLAICNLLLTVAFAFGTVNWGTGLRHKAKFFPITVLVIGAVRASRGSGQLSPGRGSSSPIPNFLHR
jgi:hypothetical protein